MRKLILLLISSISSYGVIYAQKNIIVKGKIVDAKTGVPLYASTLFAKGNPDYKTLSDDSGYFRLNLLQGNYMLRVDHIGYVAYKRNVLFSGDTLLNISLYPVDTTLDTVMVSSNRHLATPAPVAAQHIDMSESSKLPVIFGERDILKAIQLLPGIQSVGDGNSGFYVRGSSTGQNLILLDGATLYNASHLFGFFSTFNSDVVNDVTLTKGNASAKYGGRLASVVDVHLDDGKTDRTEVTGGIGLISSRLAVEGPIQKNKSSYLISARRTYADIFLKLSKDKDIRNNRIYFYDVNAKASIQLNRTNKMYLSIYSGADALGVSGDFDVDWGSKIINLRLNSTLFTKLHLNTYFIASDYKYKVGIKEDENVFHVNSRISDFNVKQDYEWLINSRHYIDFGWNSTYHVVTPSRFMGGNDSADYSQRKQRRFGWENAAYISHHFRLGSLLEVDYGFRASAYSIMGKGDYVIYNGENAVDTVSLKENQIGKTYLNIEPRGTLTFLLGNGKSIKASYDRNVQNLHLISNSLATTPTDQWIGDSYNIRPEISDQVSLGYYQAFAKDAFVFSVETYAKRLMNQIDYKDGTDLTVPQDIESELLYGRGKAYGIEFFIKKQKGKFTGWLSYTLSRSLRQINGINNNHWYPATQNQTHNIALIGIYKFAKRWSLSGNFIFYTGSAVTFPSGKYELSGNTFFYYTKRNDYHMPNYHRLDLSLTLDGRPHKHFHDSWTFALYNVYGRENPYYIKFRENPDNPLQTQAIQTSLFRWVPSITYNFNF
ncbi:hypothetical protein A9P82_02110 [Arachidicoccus ginsenosidimutans]|uniref:TonB-dependent receptor n=1 Tax=Arachidicoccus sp. BS20 TaxID=1850526 RepID=UPI0007F0E6E8|nr:TonB-dependent receptor [Arachidicoccus sp. BS20]ANI88209.1 hypothetical protein A9P82_02110 [Arachidicoccus sp. BS20]